MQQLPGQSTMTRTRDKNTCKILAVLCCIATNGFTTLAVPPPPCCLCLSPTPSFACSFLPLCSFNPLTGESSWTPPNAADGIRKLATFKSKSQRFKKRGGASGDKATRSFGGGGGAYGESEEKKQGSNDDWQTFDDPSTGRPYYYNRVTGETSWEPPM